MAERNAAAGYLAIKKETTKGTAVTPNVYVPYYKQSMATDISLISDEPVYGNKFKRFQALQGLRSHGGSAQVMAEPNTAGYFMDMVATKSGTTGANPYTHAFGASNTTDPNSYTVDISLVSQVVRFFGVEASKITFGWQKEEMVLDLDFSGLGSFYGAEIASIVTDTLTLTTTHDPTPTAGLAVSDLVKVTKVDGSSSTNYTILAVTATTVQLSATAASFAAGDMLVLRAATPSLSLLTPFLWGRTEFRFGATAAAALSATQTRLESGSEISMTHEFSDKQGTRRSGAFDPASLPRTQYDLEVKIKKYFDLPDDLKDFNAIAKKSLVMRSYSGATSQYELRVTVNNMKLSSEGLPTESGGVIFQELEYMPTYDTSDGQGFDVKVINAVSSI